MTHKLNKSNTSECKKKFNLSYHVDFAYWCEQLVGFSNKDVLEVGGSLPKEFVFEYLNAKSWTALESPEYENSLQGVSNTSQASLLPQLSNYQEYSFQSNKNLDQYKFYAGNIEELTVEHYNKYDLVFSIAAFEHIHQFPAALEKMFLALKPGGQLFSVFSPIWSAHDGHHLPTITEVSEQRKFDFHSSPIPPWGHLLMRPSELCHYLYQFTDKKTADLMVYHVYNSQHINRFFTEDYLDFLTQSSFKIKKFDLIGLCEVPEEIQQKLEILYPGRKNFSNNGIIAVLDKKNENNFDYLPINDKNLQPNIDSKNVNSETKSEEESKSYSSPQKFKNTFNIVNYLGSKPRIDIVLQATGKHGWSCSHGWLNLLQRYGLLNRTFSPVATWNADEPSDDNGLFEYLKNPEADIMILPGFDWHSQPLHKTVKWQDRWHQAQIKKIALLQECYSSEVVQGTLEWKKQMNQALVNTIGCVDALISNHEPDVSFLKNTLDVSLPIIFLPFYIDIEYFRKYKPFTKRINRALFRGNAPRHFTEKAYKERQELINILNQSPNVDLFSNNLYGAKNCFEAMQDYVEELNSYSILLNLPSLAPTFTVRPFEIMACGGVLLQNRIIGEQSQQLFQDWQHLVYYDANQPKDLIGKIEYLIINPDIANKIAAQGQELCYQLHTIECRLKTILEWTNNNFQDISFLHHFQNPHNINQSSNIVNAIPTEKELEILAKSILHSKFKVIVDAVFFQLYQTGIARVWRSLLEQWVNTEFADHIVVLDRDNTAPKINGIRYRTIPRYDYNNTEADKQMLQQICNEEEAGLFISTYYTTPIETPSVFMAYDMIPEVLGGDLNEPMWREKHHAIKHASAYISISKNTAKDLNKCFPDIPSESITVAHCGVDPLFHPASESEINAFKYKYGVTKPYFLLVGTGSGYKNGILFFQAFAKLASSYGFDIICTGIGGVLTPELRTYTSGSAVHLVQLSDEELALAYSGAVALVYPSKYEGFGMPLLEAMACGCPVITCPNASIPEVTGEAAIYVNDDDVVALANALCEVQKPNIRQALITAGLAQSKNFSWTKMAEIVSSELINTTLLPLNLREINLIIFPDWSQPEDELGLELQEVIQTLATHPNSEKITLLINTGDIDTEDAEIFLSSVVMNLMMEEEIDITEELTISLLIDLNEIQWQALLPCINARVSLEHENQKVIVKKQVEQIPLYSLENLKEVSAEQFFFQLGNSLFSQSKYQEAIIQYQKFRQIQIGNPEFYWSFSECFRRLNLLEQCFAVLQEGIKLYPVNAKLHFTVIVNYQMSGRVQEAITAANIALHNLPNNRTFQLIFNLILPSVYDQVEEINAYRQRFKQGLDNLINNIPLNNIEDQQNTLIATSCWTNFYLPYQADNVLILQSQYGSWLHQIMKANYPQWGMPLLMPPLKENQKIRIGYASHYLHSYSGTLWLTGWLRYCDHNNFEIYCYYTGNQADAITEKFQEYSDFFYHIPDNLPAVCEQIIADKLHILVYPEIGMDAPTMQMAGLRLAPVQCAAWGHPVTTGLPTIDYFLSSELMEGQNAQEHYSEKLILLPNIGVSYPKPYIPSVIKTRSDYGLSDDDVIYLCCQAPFKYLPQYDFIVAEIASRVSQAKFVFLRGNVLKPRLQRAFAAVGLNSEDYCVHLNIPERLDYLMINLLSDVYLDTFTWSGGNTSLEAIACNLPIVTCPGEFMRGRHTDSFLKMIGVTDTIASNEQEYIEIAVRLGLDKPWRRSIAERMSQNHDCLFDDKACVTGLESFYKKVCSKHFSAS
ncbi:MAG: glycosyltransferase [Aphanizomenon gracile PMC644.10]|nr:glycosyltransferase [Aphanizomenon gracile PMC644.10]